MAPETEIAMCGRYASKETAAWERYFSYRPRNPRAAPFESYNVAPTDQAPVTVEMDGERRLEQMQWGLIPSWAKDRTIGIRCINASVEDVLTKTAFHSAFVSRRCIVPAIGYYEWNPNSNSKIPHYVTDRDDKPLGLAGIWDAWTDEETGRSVRSYSILTCDANAFLAFIHNRMPVVLEPNDFDAWLIGPADKAIELACPTKRVLRAYPVSREVNNLRTNVPELTVKVTYRS